MYFDVKGKSFFIGSLWDLRKAVIGLMWKPLQFKYGIELVDTYLVVHRLAAIWLIHG